MNKLGIFFFRYTFILFTFFFLLSLSVLAQEGESTSFDQSSWEEVLEQPIIDNINWSLIPFFVDAWVRAYIHTMFGEDSEISLGQHINPSIFTEFTSDGIKQSLENFYDDKLVLEKLKESEIREDFNTTYERARTIQSPIVTMQPIEVLRYFAISRTIFLRHSEKYNDSLGVTLIAACSFGIFGRGCNLPPGDDDEHNISVIVENPTNYQ